jgi:hypothetical protein
MDKYKHSIANYPKGFKGTKVSPTKICLQFDKVDCKLRVCAEDRDLLKRISATNDCYLPVTETNQIEIETCAVGCQMPVVEEYTLGLVDAFMEYAHHHNLTYQETYNKEFSEFLIKLKQRVDNLVKKVCRGE